MWSRQSCPSHRCLGPRSVACTPPRLHRWCPCRSRRRRWYRSLRWCSARGSRWRGCRRSHCHPAAAHRCLPRQHRGRTMWSSPSTPSEHSYPRPGRSHRRDRSPGRSRRTRPRLCPGAGSGPHCRRYSLHPHRVPVPGSSQARWWRSRSPRSHHHPRHHPRLRSHSPRRCRCSGLLLR